MQHLTTLKSVRQYLGLKDETINPLIERLIERATDFVETLTSREYPVTQVVAKRFDGTGSDRMLLPAYPILSVEALQVDGQSVTASDGTSNGYLFDDKMLYLMGGQKLPYARQNVVVSWTAGYRSTESMVIPTGNLPTLTPHAGGPPVQSISVVYNATGNAMTMVDASPALGQYTLSDDGEYAFNATDGGQSVTLAYYFVPPTIVQACIELVGLKLMQRDKIGLKTKSLATESISYEDEDVTPSIAGLLDHYVKRTPN